MASERHTKRTWFCRQSFLAAIALIASALGGCTAKPEEGKSETQKSETEISLKPTTRSNFLNTVTQNEGRDSSASSSTNLLNGFSQRVFEAQLGLIRKGISPGSIDGLLGSQTRAAIRAFQEQQELPVTGVLDKATLAG